MLRALIWDVDGTIAETERDGHRVAFNEAFKELGVPWRWDVPTYGYLLRVTGGYERLLFDMECRPQAPASASEREGMAQAVHRRKNERYAQMILSGAIKARPGVHRLMDECADAGITMAIATTTSRQNVEALLAQQVGPYWRDRFAAIVCSEDAPIKKPDPLAYRLALERLGVGAREALAVEDSPNGLAAAYALGIGTLITRSAYFRYEAFAGFAGICNDLDHPITWPIGTAPRTDVAVLRQVSEAWTHADTSYSREVLSDSTK